MQINSKGLLFYLAISIFLAVLAMSRIGHSIENKLGLPLHYKLRGSIQAPKNIFILTPYKKTRMGQKTLLRDWNRSLHAKVINNLVDLNVSQIAIDLFFREYQNQANDSEFAQSLAANQTIILNQFVSSTESGIGKQVIIRNPVEIFSSAVNSLAPSLLVDTTHRKDAFYPYYSVINNSDNRDCFAYPIDADLPGGVLAGYGQDLHFPRISTLPVALLEQFLMRTGEFDTLRVNLNLTEAQVEQERFCKLSQLIREQMLNKPDLLAKIKDSSSPALKSWAESLIYLRKNLAALNQNPGIYLNFYGQPRTITTMSYEEFDDYFTQVKSNSIENIFDNSIVFIGGSFETSDEEKQDNFLTAITENNNKMSGVEITATAFANLLNNQYLKKFSSQSLFLSTLLISLLIFGLVLIKKEKMIVVLALIIAIAYIFIANQFFTKTHYWVPLVTPLTGLILSSIIVLTIRFRTTHKHKEALKSYIPGAAVRSLETMSGSASTRHVSQGVCMVTDVQGFTEISEKLPVAQMADLVDEYFSILNQCVTENDGEVYLVDGDSLTAVWAGNDELVCQPGAKAALDIIGQIDEFNQKYPLTPFHTRIGMDYGDFVLGNIGNKAHYTFAVVGNTVYTASRLEQYNKQTNTKILITDNIRRNLQDFISRDLGEIKLKGKLSATHVFELISQE